MSQFIGYTSQDMMSSTCGNGLQRTRATLGESRRPSGHPSTGVTGKKREVMTVPPALVGWAAGSLDMPQAQKGSYGRTASRLGRDPWERQGGQAREWDVCSFHPRRSCTAGAASAWPYCSDVVVVLCQLRHIRTYPHAMVQMCLMTRQSLRRCRRPSTYSASICSFETYGQSLEAVTGTVP